jgi:hypothetical protein
MRAGAKAGERPARWWQSQESVNLECTSFPVGYGRNRGPDRCRRKVKLRHYSPGVEMTDAVDAPERGHHVHEVVGEKRDEPGGELRLAGGRDADTRVGSGHRSQMESDSTSRARVDPSATWPSQSTSVRRCRRWSRRVYAHRSLAPTFRIRRQNSGEGQRLRDSHW